MRRPPLHYVFLGTSGAIPSVERDTTSLVFVAPEGAVLIDCGGSPLAKLKRAGVDPAILRAVLITHTHPDHAYGLPALIQNLYLLKRVEPLQVICRPEHAGSLRRLVALFGLWERDGLFPIGLRGIRLDEGADALALGSLAFRTSPNDHGSMPNFAVRVDAGAGRSVVYSSDTAPCDAVVRLARAAGTLIHEATFPHRDRGRFGVHSTAREAGEIAARAGVGRLVLTHVEADYHREVEALAEEARKSFGGPVEIAREFVPYPI